MAGAVWRLCRQRGTILRRRRWFDAAVSRRQMYRPHDRMTAAPTSVQTVGQTEGQTEGGIVLAGRSPGHQAMAHPPSITCACPVVKAASSDPR